MNYSKNLMILALPLIITTAHARYVQDNDYSLNNPVYETEAPHYREQWPHNLGRDIAQDFKNYMAPERLWYLGGAFASSGILANTGLDKSVARHWQNNIRSTTTNHFFHLPQKIGGLSYYYAPVYLLAMGAGHMGEQDTFGNVLYHWGYRSFRTFIVGGPQQATFTYLLGSGRPNRGDHSKWQPFKHNTGVSGHAFYGAIPFLTAAMMTNHPALRYTLYAVSTLPGLARVNSNYHYLSQVVLAWSIAYLSADSVYTTDEEREPKFQMRIEGRADGLMLRAHWTF